MPRAQAPSLPQQVAIYGAGGFGLRLAGALEAAGTEVVGFADKAGRAPAGFRALTVPQVSDSGLPLFIGISNPSVNMAALINELQVYGCSLIVNPVQAVTALRRAGIDLTNYWLTGDVNLYDRERIEINAAREQLHDVRSLEVFDGIISYRQHGDLLAMHAPDPLSEQYFPSDVPFLTMGMRYVDAGAYVGDTVRALANISNSLAAILSFEPDLANYAKLSHEIRHLNLSEAYALPLALSDVTAVLRFDSNAAASAHFDETGTTHVQAVSLDSLAPEWAPTHIKMDIEGAELSALIGMERTLREFRPALAIAVYHQPSHHWAILNWVSSLDLGYRFFMRMYAEQTFETILYCIPNLSAERSRR